MSNVMPGGLHGRTWPDLCNMGIMQNTRRMLLGHHKLFLVRKKERKNERKNGMRQQDY